MHFKMICLLGLLQNLHKVCPLKLFFFYDPANVGHPVNLSYNSIHEEFSRTHTIQASNWSVYRHRNGSRKPIYFTNQSVSKYWSRGLEVIKPVKNENRDYSTNSWVMGIFQNTIVRSWESFKFVSITLKSWNLAGMVVGWLIELVDHYSLRAIWVDHW